jgi:hypothetical protein
MIPIELLHDSTMIVNKEISSCGTAEPFVLICGGRLVKMKGVALYVPRIPKPN